MQQQYRDDPLMELYQAQPNLVDEIKNFDLKSLKDIASLHQSQMHNLLVSCSMADRENIDNFLAICKGANALVAWIESMQEQIAANQILAREQQENADNG